MVRHNIFNKSQKITGYVQITFCKLSNGQRDFSEYIIKRKLTLKNSLIYIGTQEPIRDVLPSVVSLDLYCTQLDPESHLHMKHYPK